MAGFGQCVDDLIKLRATMEATWLYQHGEDALIPAALGPALQRLEMDSTASASAPISNHESSDGSSFRTGARQHHANKSGNGLRKKPGGQGRREYMRQRREVQKVERNTATLELQALQNEETLLRQALAAVEQDKKALMKAKGPKR
jgi:hypothetical protein